MYVRGGSEGFLQPRGMDPRVTPHVGRGAAPRCQPELWHHAVGGECASAATRDCSRAQRERCLCRQHVVCAIPAARIAPMGSPWVFMSHLGRGCFGATTQAHGVRRLRGCRVPSAVAERVYNREGRKLVQGLASAMMGTSFAQFARGEPVVAAMEQVSSRC